MGRMKNYYEFSQLLPGMTVDELLDRLRTETDEYRTKLIEWELETRCCDSTSQPSPAAFGSTGAPVRG
jgi:hypothetical protein